MNLVYIPHLSAALRTTEAGVSLQDAQRLMGVLFYSADSWMHHLAQFPSLTLPEIKTLGKCIAGQFYWNN